MKILATTSALLLVTFVPAESQEPGGPQSHAIVEHAERIEWQPAPGSLPAGAQVAVLEGDPAEPGPFTMRLRMPDGYLIPPHFHPSAERITVISGTFHLGMGDAVGESPETRLLPGDYAALEANNPHYARAEGETVVQLNNIGPWSLTYVDPSDDPRNQRR